MRLTEGIRRRRGRLDRLARESFRREALDRRLGGRCGVLRVQANSPLLPPGFDFGLKSVDSSLPVVEMAVDGQGFEPLPSLDGANVAIETGGNLLPGFEALIRNTGR